MNKKFKPVSLRNILLSIVCCTFLLSMKSPDDDPFEYFNDKAFVIKRGVNVSHWLSQSRMRGSERENFFTADYMKFIASVNYDHIRLPIDEVQMWDSTGSKDKEAFVLLHHAILWAAENKLRVIVDLHILKIRPSDPKKNPLWTEPAAQEHFFQCWRDLSGELKKYPIGMVAYELLNEPTAPDPQEWNELSQKTLAIIRENEPDRKIIIGSNWYNSVKTINDLVVTKHDKNIILNFHYYIPYLLTHHEAGWTDIKDFRAPVFYPGITVRPEDIVGLSPDLFKRVKAHWEQNNFDRDAMESLMMEPIMVARKYKLSLYCGEFGCLLTVPESSRFQWYRDMRYCLEKNDIAWSNWDFNSNNFGIINGKIDSANKELIQILTGD